LSSTSLKPSPSTFRAVALQVYRALALAVIVYLMHAHYVREKTDLDRPLQLSEIRELLPDAAALTDNSERFGKDVADKDGRRIGFAIRTSPNCNNIIGYCGPTDALIVFDKDFKALGVRIRSSYDTKEHVGDVKGDPYFLKLWDGKTWDAIAHMDIKKEGIEGVSGATLTSMAVAESVVRRLSIAEQEMAPPPPMRVAVRDIVLFVGVALGTFVCFSSVRGKPWVRRGWQIFIVGVIGFWNGDLLAQTLLHGWAYAGVAWRMAPGLALLAAAALLIPWTTRRALYCQYLCPHGAVQEWMNRIAPKKWKVQLHPGLANGLRWLPFFLLLIAIAVTLLRLPTDLASIEPFDAYLLSAAGWATLTIAGVGLLAALFVPMAYCKFGCPTGALLEFVRSHGSLDTFGKRDVAALVLVAWSVGLFLFHAEIWRVIAGL
jgi:NosR/NirI family transcriptional regulator, nitrous oxide reductase regulator